MGWIGYNVSNKDTAFNFYNKYLGFKKMVLEGDLDFIIMTFSDNTLFEVINPNTPASVPVNYNVIGFEVENFEEAQSILKNRNVEFIGEPVKIPGFHFQFFKGPDEIVYEIIEIAN